MKSKKILIITIIIILVLAVAGTVFGYLYMATDTFKSDKELFSKYISQNIETFQKIEDSQITQMYKNMKNEEKYDISTNLKMKYSEGGEVSNPINNLSAQLNFQRDDAEQYYYANGQILFNNQKYLQTEIIKDQGLYGIRLPEVKQFLSIKDDDNLEKVASEIGVESTTIKEIMDVIDGKTEITEEIMTEDDVKQLKEKYLKIITDTIANGTFGSNKKAIITYNNNKIETKAYTVSLTSQQVEELIKQILNELKTEDIIMENDKIKPYKEQISNAIDGVLQKISDETEVPEIKITVYENKENVIRTVLEIGLNKIVIENVETNEELTSKIQVSQIVSEKTNEYDIELTKKTTDNQEDLNLVVNITIDENVYTISLVNEMNSEEDSIKLNTSINYKKDILTVEGIIENEINLKNDFEKKQTLENSNITLNDLKEDRRINIINTIKESMPAIIKNEIESLKNNLGLNKDETEEPKQNEEMTQTEINQFNSKFEFYTGDEVSSENVKKLLDVVGNNMNAYSIKTLEDQENNELVRPEDIRYNIKVQIEKDKVNKEGLDKILEKIYDTKKYKVSIIYKGENKLIDYIEIEGVK